MNRRAMLTAGPASIAALALPEMADAEPKTDPIVALYHEWIDARRTWRDLADLPGNERWDDPRSLEAEDRQDRAERLMLDLTPISKEGIAALSALAWFLVSPATNDPEKFAVRAQSYDCRALMAIWRACTGLDGYPVT